MKALPVALVSVLLGIAIGVAVGYSRVSPSGEFSAPTGRNVGPGEDLSTAKVVVDEPSYNFGTMQRGTNRRHEFTIRNQGDAPLTLTAGETTCKCTQFDVTPDPIPPGESAKIGLEWTAKSVPGPFRQSATLHTSDPIRRSISLSVEGEVVEPSGLVPNSFELGEVRSGEAAEASVYFFSHDKKDLEVKATGPSGEEVSDLFDVDVQPADPKDLPKPGAISGYKVTLTAKPGLPLGQVMEWVTLSTNQPEVEQIEVPVFGRVAGDISVHGSGWIENSGVLNLRTVSSSKGAKRRLLLSVKGEHAAETKFELLSVDPKVLKVELGETVRRSDNVYHTYITIEVPQGTRPMVRLNTDQGEDGIVRLKTTHPQSPEMALRVRFAVSL